MRRSLIPKAVLFVIVSWAGAAWAGDLMKLNPVSGRFDIYATSPAVAGSINPTSLNATNSPSSGQVPSKSSGGNQFEWITPASGGASALATANGTSAGFTATVSSPTAAINADQSVLKFSLTSSATGFLTIAYSTVSVVGNRTVTSTDSIIVVTCGSACTQTLPTAVGISGKAYSIKNLSANGIYVTVATTGGQAIDDDTTQIMYLKNTNLEVVANGSAWYIR